MDTENVTAEIKRLAESEDTIQIRCQCPNEIESFDCLCKICREEMEEAMDRIEKDSEVA